jgi:hypothetical protein
MGRPSHDPTVRIDNRIAEEMAQAHDTEFTPRGLYSDPHAGESFVRAVVDDYRDGSPEVPAKARPTLENAARFLTTDKRLRADVVGHAAKGEDLDEKKLAESRGENVRAALEKQGVEKDHIATSISILGGSSGRSAEVFMYYFAYSREGHRAAGVKGKPAEKQMARDEKRSREKLGEVL